MSERFVAATPPGLESLVEGELSALGLVPSREGAERVGFSGARAGLYRAALWLRVAERVSLRLGRFPAASFPELVRASAALEWEKALIPSRPVLLRARCRRSKLYHEKAVCQRVAEGMRRRLGREPALAGEEEGAQLVSIRVESDRCDVELDASGPLHRRGYRQALAKAPLRETLAAALALASGWDRRSPLLDPFCGSGTIVIEAALLAAGIAPGRGRRFPFMEWPSFRPSEWEPLLAAAGGDPGARRPALRGSDRDAGAIEAARANAGRAGVAELVEFSVSAVSAAEVPPGPGAIVTNPPYGWRVRGGPDVRNVYAAFGRLVRERAPGWSVAFLAPADVLARATGLPLLPGHTTKNGGLDVKLYAGRAAQG